VRLTLVCVLGFALVPGCARGTTLPEAAGRLESDSRGVLYDAARRLGGAHPSIAVDDRRACGSGRARQVWQGAVPLRHGPDPRVDLDNATDVTIGLARARGYRLERPPALTRRVRTFSLTRDGSRMVVRLQSGHRSSLRVDASTPCLPPT
jgi:hypothetical protein